MKRLLFILSIFLLFACDSKITKETVVTNAEGEVPLKFPMENYLDADWNRRDPLTVGKLIKVKGKWDWLKSVKGGFGGPQDFPDLPPSNPADDGQVVEESVVPMEQLSTRYVNTAPRRNDRPRRTQKSSPHISHAWEKETGYDMALLEVCKGLIIKDRAERVRLLRIKVNEMWNEGTIATPAQREEFTVRALEPYADVFALNDKECGEVIGPQFDIDTADAKPICHQPRRLSPAKYKQIEAEVKRLTEMGRIADGNGSWSSPIVPVSKPDGSIRLCVDYRLLNQVTKRDLYPLPRIGDLIEGVGQLNIKYLSTVDLKAGFHQIKVREDSQEKCAFIWPGGLHKYLYMPFGCKNAPSVFQRVMDQTIAGIPRKHCQIYIDDVIFKSETFEQHIQICSEVFERFRQKGLMVSLEKSHFMRQNVSYLGFQLTSEGLLPGDKKIKAVKAFPIPKDVTGIKSFLGLINYFRKFIKDCSKIAHPMTKLMRKDTEFVWGEEQNEAFEKLKTALIDSAMLKYPNPNKPYLLTTDASYSGMGAVLQQEDENERLRPVAFASRSLSDAETRYTVTDLEAAGVVWALRYFKYLILGADITIETDHQALHHLARGADPKLNHLFRWRLLLEEFNFDGNLKIIYKKGVENVVADCLSRGPASKPGDVQLPAQRFQFMEDRSAKPIVLPEEVQKEFDSQFMEIAALLETVPAKDSHNSIVTLQQSDELISALTRFLETKELPDDIKIRKLLLILSESSFVEDGILKKKYKVGKHETDELIFVPQCCVDQLLNEVHRLPLGGHQSAEKTLIRLRRRYYWVGMRQAVVNYCRSCVECARWRGQHRRNFPPLSPTTPPDYPWEKVGMDILQLPLTENENKYVLVMIDYLTKFCMAEPMPNQTMPVVVDAFIRMLSLGLPAVVVSDQGKQFTGSLTTELCARLGMKQVLTTAFWSRANGEVESMNKTLISYLAKVIGKEKEWDLLLPLALVAYNSSPHSTTKQSPYELMFGRRPNMPSESPIALTPSAYVEDDPIHKLHVRLKRAWIAAKVWSEEMQQKYKVAYDKNKVYEFDFVVGDKVWRFDKGKKAGKFTKLAKCYTGPYMVTKVHPPTLTIDENGEDRIVHGQQVSKAFQQSIDRGIHYFPKRKKSNELRNPENAGSVPPETAGERVEQPRQISRYNLRKNPKPLYA